MDRREFIQTLIVASAISVSSKSLAGIWRLTEQHNVEKRCRLLTVLQQTLVPVPTRFINDNINLVSFISLMIEQSLSSKDKVALENALDLLESQLLSCTEGELKENLTQVVNDVKYADMVLKIRNFALIGLFSHPKVVAELPPTMGYQAC